MTDSKYASLLFILRLWRVLRIMMRVYRMFTRQNRLLEADYQELLAEKRHHIDALLDSPLNYKQEWKAKLNSMQAAGGKTNVKKDKDLESMLDKKDQELADLRNNLDKRA